MNNSEFALIIYAPDQCNCFSAMPDERAIIFLANTRIAPCASQRSLLLPFTFFMNTNDLQYLNYFLFFASHSRSIEFRSRKVIYGKGSTARRCQCYYYLLNAVLFYLQMGSERERKSGKSIRKEKSHLL